MRLARRRRLSPAALVLVIAALVLPVATGTSGAQEEEPPLRVWIRDDASTRFDSLFPGVLFALEGGTQSRGITIVVENTTDAAIEEVHVRAPGVPDCTRAIGTVAPGPERRRAFRCVVEPREDAFVPWERAEELTRGFTFGVEMAPTWPAEARVERGAGFTFTLEVVGLLEGRPISTRLECEPSPLPDAGPCFQISRTEEVLPELEMELAAAGDRSIAVTVTNPARYERYVGSLRGGVGSRIPSIGPDGTGLDFDPNRLGEIWWDLPPSWRENVPLRCDPLPGTIAPFSAVSTECTWEPVTDTPVAGVGVQLRTPEVENPLFPLLGGPTLSVDMASASLQFQRHEGGLSVDVSPGNVLIGPGESPELAVTVTNTGSVPVSEVAVTQPFTRVRTGSSEKVEVLADCAASLGTLWPGEARSYSCSGAEWIDGATYFLALGEAGTDRIPIAAFRRIRLIDLRAAVAPSFSAEVLPRVQGGVPGSEVEMTLRVRVPAASEWVTARVVDQVRPTCSGEWDSYPWGLREDAVVDLICRVRVPADGSVAEWRPTVVLEERDGSDFFGQPLRSSVLRPVGWVDPERSAQDLAVTVLPRSATVRRGGDTQLDLTVTNTSGDILYDVRSMVLHPDQTLSGGGRAGFEGSSRFGGYGDIVAIADDCDRAIGELAPGATATYSCEIAAPLDFWTAYSVGRHTVRLAAHAVGVNGSQEREAFATGYADVTTNGDDGLGVELLGPTEPVTVGQRVEFRVRVTNRGGTQYPYLNVWSADLPACDRNVELVLRDDQGLWVSNLLPPGNSDSSIEFTCTAIAGEQLQPGESQLHVVGWGPAGDGDASSPVATAVSSPVTLVSAPGSPTTTEPPPTPPPGPGPSPTVPSPGVTPPTPPSPSPSPFPGPAVPAPSPPALPVPAPAGPGPVGPGFAGPSPTESSDLVDESGVASTDVASPASPDETATSTDSSNVPPESAGATDGGLSVQGRSELAAPDPERSPDSESFSTERPAVESRAEVLSIVSSAQPFSSVSLVLVVAIAALLAIRSLLSTPGRTPPGGSHLVDEEDPSQAEALS